MIITCKCLNVTISTKSSDLQEVDTAFLESLEQLDPFFKEAIYTVELVRISQAVSSLIEARNVGNWIIHKCLNCSINTHAIQRGEPFVLVHQAMLTNPTDITALKTVAKYSPVYRIVINQLNDTTPAGKLPVSQMTEPVQSALTAIQKQMSESIQQEVARVEESVRAFSDQQYSALEEFRENARNDHRALVQILCEGVPTAAKPSIIERSQSRPVSSSDRQILPSLSTSVPYLPFINMPVNPLSPIPIVIASPVRRQLTAEEQMSANKMLKTSSSTPLVSETSGVLGREKRVKSKLFSDIASGQSHKTEGSIDAEGLFDLEGMDDTPAEVFHSEEETDTDDSGSRDEGIYIPRSRSGQFNLAKSLPMNVPTFLSLQMRGGQDEEEDRKRPQDPMDIAASIKALARSVHGDANVFGELPRPRFSTQI